MFNGYKCNSIKLKNAKTDHFKGYWTMVHMVINGTTTPVYTEICWFEVLGLPSPYPDIHIVLKLNTCNNHCRRAINRKYKKKPIVKKICGTSFDTIRLADSYQIWIEKLTLFVFLITAKAIDSSNHSINLELVDIAELIKNDQFDASHIDERDHNNDNQIINDNDICKDIVNEFKHSENQSTDNNFIPIRIYLNIHDSPSQYYLEYSSSNNTVYISWLNESLPIKNLSNNDDKNFFCIPLETTYEKIWEYMWNTWIKFIGNYSAIIHPDIKEHNNQLAESGVRDFKVRSIKYVTTIFL